MSDGAPITALDVEALKQEFPILARDAYGKRLVYLDSSASAQKPCAVIDALKIHPNVNASYNEEAKEITYYDAEHLGFAVDTEQGLLSPVIKNAGDLSLGGLARAISDIAGRARSGDLKPDELSGGTFTITNIGSQGALFDTPILVPPQAAMLGTGAIVKRPVVVKDDSGNESIGVRSMFFGWTFHRCSNKFRSLFDRCWSDGCSIDVRSVFDGFSSDGHSTDFQKSSE